MCILLEQAALGVFGAAFGLGALLFGEIGMLAKISLFFMCLRLKISVKIFLQIRELGGDGREK